MKPKTLKKIVLSIATACLVYQVSSCVHNYRKYRASLIKPSKMITVETDESYPKDITKHVHKVREVAEKDYMSVIKELKTPLEAKLYCTKILEYKKDSVVYGKSDYWASFKHIHKNKKDDCDGGALAAAAILSDNGFPPYIAIISNAKDVHAVFVYKTTKGEYCSIGINYSDCLSGCKNIEELKCKLGKYTSIQIYDLSKRFPNYIDNDRNNDLRNKFF